MLFTLLKNLYEISSEVYPNISENLIGMSEAIWSVIFILIYCIIYWVNIKSNVNAAISMPGKFTLNPSSEVYNWNGRY